MSSNSWIRSFFNFLEEFLLHLFGRYKSDVGACNLLEVRKYFESLQNLLESPTKFSVASLHKSERMPYTVMLLTALATNVVASSDPRNLSVDWRRSRTNSTFIEFSYASSNALNNLHNRECSRTLQAVIFWMVRASKIFNPLWCFYSQTVNWCPPLPLRTVLQKDRKCIGGDRFESTFDVSRLFEIEELCKSFEFWPEAADHWLLASLAALQMVVYVMVQRTWDFLRLEPTFYLFFVRVYRNAYLSKHFRRCGRGRTSVSMIW